MHPRLARGWEALPKPVQDVIATVVDTLQRVPIPPPAEPRSDATVRLFIAPANYAGQGYRWARAVSQNPAITASNMVYAEINPFDYPADYAIRGRTVTHSRRWQRAQLHALSTRFTHVLVEAQMPPIGGLWNQDVVRQVRALGGSGVRVGMVCHGSDIRSPHRHRDADPWSPFQDDSWVPVNALETFMRWNRAILDELSLPTFVSTPGLMADVPYAHLLPVVIEPERWASREAVLQREQPRVVHVPSNPLVKGTAQIEPVLRALHAEGVIEYVSVVGRPHAEMPEILATADIVLDQFRLGDYGVAACEAMAAGRLVISHVAPDARAVLSKLGHELPIMQATIDDLGDVIRRVLGDRQSARALAAEGPGFVRTMHDGRFSRTVLEREFLLVA